MRTLKGVIKTWEILNKLHFREARFPSSQNQLKLKKQKTFFGR